MQMTRLTFNAFLTAGAVAFGLIGGADARTVALWPMEYNAFNPDNGGRCAVDAANDLTVANVNGHVEAVEWGPGWNLPPNPDATEGLRFQPVNRTSVHSASGQKSVFANPTFAERYLKPSQAFTLEGWMKMESLPKDYFWVIATAFGSGDNNRFLFTLRNNNGGCTKVTHPDAKDWVSFQVWSGRPAIGECVLWKPEGDDLDNLLSKWHHFALTHNPANADGNAEWRFYWDGELKGTKVCDGPGTDATVTDTSFTLNGRLQGSSLPGYLDYCRVSDVALEADELLCAGGQGTIIPKPVDKEANTLVYWPFGRTPDGGIDGSPAVGSAFLVGGAVDGRTSSQSRMNRLVFSGSSDCAFTGPVPNAATTLKPQSGNAGSLHSTRRVDGTVVEIKDLGLQTTLTNDFTVEGWYKYERRDTDVLGSWHYLCGAMDTTGWKLQAYIRPDDGKQYYSFHVQENGTYIHSVGSVNLGPLDDGVWTHVAITYDADGHEGDGFRSGLWKFYKNGVFSGELYNTKAIDPGRAMPSAFYLGGGTLNDATHALGKFDSWRVSKATLAPEQFLCANGAGARDATNVVAFWPLDAKQGLYVDGTDLTGNYTFESARDDKFCAKAVEDTPPQADLDPANGSVGLGGDGGTASYFQCFDPDVLSLFSTDSWTFETWMKCTDNSKGWMIVFWPNGNSISKSTNPSGCISLTYRPKESGGFVIWNNTMVSGTSDAVFRGTDGQAIKLVQNEWTHVALEFEKLGSNGQWSLFTNGVLAATITGAFGSYPYISNVLFGSRPAAPQTFYGRMAGMRLSKTALDPKDFLCNRTVDDAKATRAFWPLDYENGKLDLDSRIRCDQALAATGVSGTDARARGCVPRPDVSPDYRGSRKANRGSVELAANGNIAGEVAEDYVGAKFTVEGWFKWANAAGATCETLAGNLGAASGGGWKLMVDSIVSPAKFRIFARGPVQATPFVDGRFAADVEAGVWHHLALSYDPTKSFGTWSLMIDGQAAGTVVNEWRPSVFVPGANVFRLGSGTAFVGGLDMWRLSVGVLGPDEILWAEPAGTLLLLR